MTKTRIQNQRPIAKGRHQKPNRRWSTRENPPLGINWGGKVWPGTGAGTATPAAVWLFDTGLAAAGILAGEVRLNQVNGAAVTHVFVSKTVQSGVDPTASWAVNDPLRVYYRDDTSMWVEYKITAVSSQTGYFDYTVTYTANSGGFTTPPDGTPLLLIERTATSPGTQMPDPNAPPFDPADMTIDEVKAEVDAWTQTGDELIAMIQAVLDLERAGKDRATLVAWLDAKLGVV
jgi:hypothetical protein